MTHLTRPKSSKGRSRPAMNSSQDTDDSQRPPVPRDSPAHSRADRSLRPQSQPTVWQAGQRRQMLQQGPGAPAESLNKYKVLPSIERKRSEVSPGLDSVMSNLSLCDGAVLPQRHEESEFPAEIRISSSGEDRRPDNGHLCPQPPYPGRARSREAGASLLLVIRAPCGRRFQQHFDPADTLQTVKTRAEAMHGAQYGDVSIQTMDVPRSTFTDLDMTLAQCGILNRSVLCISQNDP